MKNIFFILLISFNCFGQQLTLDQVKFFEEKIRPVLVNDCYKCHSSQSEKVKGKLLLDNKANLLKGGETGPSIIVGKPEESLLYKALTYKDPDIQMPPQGKKLPDNVVQDFYIWIKMGAPDPRVGGVSKSYGKLDELAKTHWSFQPISKPATPRTSFDTWVKNPIDNFIASKLEQNRLSPSNPTDKRTLIRRATFDLTGLPPSEVEIQNFLKDDSSNAFEKIIDRLLSSPHYGEKWGRHWLDIARYSDTSGNPQRRNETTYPYAWAYRDYVIGSFNQDKPFNRFVLEQIAGDQLKEKTNNWTVAGVGFLTVGKRNNDKNDIIDDRIDAISKGFMSLTVSCARCHDHKFDPISTKDYYALHGVFNSIIEPKDKPIIYIPPQKDYSEYLKEKEKLEAQLKLFITTNYNNAFFNYKTNTIKVLSSLYDLKMISESKRQNYIRENQVNEQLLQKWSRFLLPKENLLKGLKVGAKGEKEAKKKKAVSELVWGPLILALQTKPNDFAQYSKNLSEMEPNGFIKGYLTPQFTTSFLGVAAAYQYALIEADKQWRILKAKSPQATELPNSDAEEFRRAVFVSGPLDIDKTNFQRFLENNQKMMRFNNEISNRENKLLELEGNHDGAPARAMVVSDVVAENSKVFVKGDPKTLGAEVPRRFLELIDKTEKPFTNGSGRLELAQAIIDPNNPLTPRTIVNRIWQHHFGKGIVATPDDFGTQGERPTHPELLNWLASTFVEEGWSQKKMHKLIMTSATYQQSSLHNAAYSVIDPDNKFLWKMNILRLEFEALRDTILAIGGKLDKSIGGKPDNLLVREDGHYSTRRTIYGLIDRRNLNDLFSTFDFANPDMTNGRRFETTVPKQALFLMNSPIIYEQIKNVVSRPEFQILNNDNARVIFLYDIIYQRIPNQEEIQTALAYISSVKTEPNKVSPWEKFAHILMMGNEMVFVN
jgi:hypothetical protein